MLPQSHVRARRRLGSADQVYIVDNAFGARVLVRCSHPPHPPVSSRYPLADITQLEPGGSATEVHIECGLTVDMKAYNQDKPFVFNKADHDVTFSFEFVEPSKIIEQALVISEKSILHTNTLTE